MSKLNSKFVILCSLICHCLIANCLILDREYLKGIYGHKLESLRVLDLSNRNLNKIDSNAFKGLAKLEILDLSNNEIEEIQSRSFEYLFNLKRLKLSNNKLKIIDENSFQGLNELEILCLDNNEIKKLDKGSFSGVSKLKLLKLNNNRLIEIDFDANFRYSIEVIQLFNNDRLITGFSSQLTLSFYYPQTQLNSDDFDQEKLNEFGFIPDWNYFFYQFENTNWNDFLEPIDRSKKKESLEEKIRDVRGYVFRNNVLGIGNLTMEMENRERELIESERRERERRERERREREWGERDRDQF